MSAITFLLRKICIADALADNMLTTNEYFPRKNTLSIYMVNHVIWGDNLGFKWATRRRACSGFSHILLGE
jgi:hypothetical protein